MCGVAKMLQDSVKGLVLISGKPDNFIAGADISMLDAVDSAAGMTDLARQGQTLMDRLARIPKPVVAAIHGACLGGGLEVALACSYRIATSGAKTKLGLPEVMLGLLPGSGGTQRLPRAVGIQEAISLMTQGKSLSADRAKKAGLIHEVVDPAALETVALQAAKELIAGTLKPPKRSPGLLAMLLEGNPLGRMILWSQAEKAINKAAGGHYPAPLAILEAIKAGVENGHAEGSKTEARLFGELGMTPVSRALRGVFHAQTAAKKNPYDKPAVSAATVGVLGAGLMGAGVAQVTASAGLNVVLKDRDAAAIARGEKQIDNNLSSSVKKRRMTQFDKDRTLARVMGVSDTDDAWRTHLGRADVVIEAVFEDLALKHRVIKEIEPLMKPGAVFASNTSALPLSSIATAAADPSRVLGMHYFSPVDKMPLLEIIPHAGTSRAALSAAYDLGLKQGKTVIVVKDVPGFYVNRSLAPWATEALLLVQEGVEPEALDSAVRKFGYPVGPVTLADEVRTEARERFSSAVTFWAVPACVRSVSMYLLIRMLR
jgi:enoyl-CoA hydratase / long-chain 3-hydroxyacyl-CoA dehydrogenase